MENIFDFLISAFIVIFALYFFYTQIVCSRPSDKYHNESWKTRNKKDKFF